MVKTKTILSVKNFSVICICNDDSTQGNFSCISKFSSFFFLSCPHSLSLSISNSLYQHIRCLDCWWTSFSCGFSIFFWIRFDIDEIRHTFFNLLIFFWWTCVCVMFVSQTFHELIHHGEKLEKILIYLRLNFVFFLTSFLYGILFELLLL